MAVTQEQVDGAFAGVFDDILTTYGEAKAEAERRGFVVPPLVDGLKAAVARAQDGT